MNFAGIFFLSFFVEGFIEYTLGGVLKNGQRAILKWAALALGAALAIAYNVDLLAQFGLVSTIPFVGEIVTGVIIGRGSNYVHDVLGAFTKLKDSLKG